MPGHKPRTNKGLAIAAVLMCLACGVSFTQSSASHSPITDTQTPDMFVAGNTDDSQIQSDGAVAEKYRCRRGEHTGGCHSHRSACCRYPGT